MDDAPAHSPPPPPAPGLSPSPGHGGGAAAADTNGAPPSQTRRRRGVVRRTLTIGVTAYLAWCSVLLVVQGSLVFPRYITGPAPMAVPPGAEQVWITTAEGYRVEGLFFPAPGREGGEGGAVIFAHGNGELIQHTTDIARMYNAWGVSVLLPEYRGYGNSGGTPSQRAIVADFLAFREWLAARPEVDAGAIILHGRSLGGGVVAQVAAEHPPAALILESTFTSVASFSWSYGVPPFLVRHPFRTDEVVASLSGVPILVMHGTSDTIVPVSHGRRLHALAPGSAYYETGDNHLNFPTDGAAYRREIGEFLGRHLRVTAP